MNKRTPVSVYRLFSSLKISKFFLTVPQRTPCIIDGDYQYFISGVDNLFSVISVPIMTALYY